MDIKVANITQTALLYYFNKGAEINLKKKKRHLHERFNLIKGL